MAFAPVFKNLLWYVSGRPWTIEALLRFVGVFGNGVLVVAGCVVSAWVVTRIHRAHQRGVLVTFIIAMTAPRVPWIARLVSDLYGNSRFAASLVTEVLSQLQWGTLVLAAGLWFTRAKRSAAMDRKIRRATVLAVSLALFQFLINAAWSVRWIPPSLLTWDSLDVATIFAYTYLAVLLWRTESVRPPPVLSRTA
jgi:hypothetical protein